jgi:hypothetical protein
VRAAYGRGKLGAKEKSVIDRCAVNAYRPYVKNGYKGAPPTLREFHAEL